MLIAVAVSAALAILCVCVLIREKGGMAWLKEGRGRYAGFQSAYEMNAQYTNGCSGQGPPGPCTGGTQSDCPGAFVGDNTSDGTVYQCTENNIGVSAARPPLR